MSLSDLAAVMQAHRAWVTGWTIVIVEDEPDNLDVVVRLLRFYGAKVFTAANGEEGFVLIEREHPTFVLTDLSMPVLDGWALLKKLQGDDALKRIPAIALTAHAMLGDRERVLEAGFTTYFSKPIDPYEFLLGLLELFPAVRESEPSTPIILSLAEEATEHDDPTPSSPGV
jgi:CheY-like chemotaxis protein